MFTSAHPKNNRRVSALAPLCDAVMNDNCERTTIIHPSRGAGLSIFLEKKLSDRSAPIKSGSHPRIKSAGRLFRGHVLETPTVDGRTPEFGELLGLAKDFTSRARLHGAKLVQVAASDPKIST